MARISTYIEDTILTGTDKVIGTDASGNVTKNFTLDSILSFVELNSSTPTATAPVINGGTGLATGDQIYDFVTGQNYLTGNETITLSGDLSGSGTTSISATIANEAIEASMLNGNVISGQTELLSGVAGTNELLISDSGIVKKTDVGALETYMQNNLTFSSNTDVDVNVANLTARLPEITENITIGDAPDVTITTSGDLTVTGDLTVSGTTTTVNSNTVTVDDPIFTLGGDTAPASDDNKDRGIEFRYHDGANAKLGFFGFDDSTGKFTFLTAATNTSEVFSGTKATLDINNIDLAGSITSVDGATPTDGQILIGNTTNSDMQLGTITAGEGINITNAAGSITIASEDASDSNKGIVELATTAEALEGTSTLTAVTPAGLAARSWSGLIGNGSATSINVIHSLHTRDVIIQLYDNSTYDTVYADVVRTTVDTATITFSTAPAADSIKVLVNKID